MTTRPPKVRETKQTPGLPHRLHHHQRRQGAGGGAEPEERGGVPPLHQFHQVVFRTLIFVLAIVLYSLYTVFKGEVRREEFRLLLILLFSDDLFYLRDFLLKSIEPLINIDLFSRR